MKKNIQPGLEKALGLARKYEIAGSVEMLDSALKELPNFRVTVPLVGGFSTGKSSLINAALNEHLLSTDITPETAVPTEIFFGNNTVELVPFDDGKSTITSLSDFDPNTLRIEKYKLVKIGLSSPLFEKIPSVKVVDMPGFDSGIEFHNRAIDDYLPHSLAYILVTSANEGTLRESVISFLNEMKIYNVPVYTVITKSGSVVSDELEKIKEHLSDTIRRFLKIDDVKIAVTESKGKRANVEEFKEILFDIQNKSDDIFNDYYTNRLLSSCDKIEDQITHLLNYSDMSLDELRVEKERHEREMEELNRKVSNERDSFAKQIDNVVASLNSRLSQNLNASSQTLEAMLLQGNDISDKLNSIARTTVATVLQTELAPKVKKYVEKVSEMINVSSYGKEVQLSEFQKNQLTRAEKFINEGVKPLATAVGAVIGACIGGAFGAAIGAAIGALVSFVSGSAVDSVKEKQRKEKAHNQVKQIIESFTTDVTNAVKEQIYSNIDEINAELAKDIEEKRTLIAKAIEESEQKILEGTQHRQAEIEELNADLAELRGIRDGI